MHLFRVPTRIGEGILTLKLALLIAAAFCGLALVAIDFSWVDVDGNQHLPGWLGLSLFAGWASFAVRR
jgi:hypothetical protein